MMLLLALLATAAPAQDAPVDPLAPAREGKIQCTVPNVEKKTCAAITTYTPTASGYLNETEMLVSPAPLITARISAPLTIEGDAACGITKAEDFAAAQVMQDGKTWSAEQAKPILDQMMAVLAPYFGKKSCARIKTVNGALVQESDMDGVAQPQFTVPMLWISPADGYRIGL
jgi:hypothetical protein